MININEYLTFITRVSVCKLTYSKGQLNNISDNKSDNTYIKNPRRLNIYKGFRQFFADWTGLEPATSAVTGRHSNQLNYQSVS